MNILILITEYLGPALNFVPKGECLARFALFTTVVIE